MDYVVRLITWKSNSRFRPELREISETKNLLKINLKTFHPQKLPSNRRLKPENFSIAHSNEQN